MNMFESIMKNSEEDIVEHISELYFPDGTECESIEQLREKYNDEWAFERFCEETLEKWLTEMFYEEEYAAVSEIDKTGEMGVIIDELRAALGLPQNEKLNEYAERLKEFTTDTELLKKARNAVYTQKELAVKLNEGCDDILLVSGSFSIPLSVKNVTYTAVGDPTIKCADKATLTMYGIKLTGISIGSDDEYTDDLVKLIAAFSIGAPSSYVYISDRLDQTKRFDSSYECQKYVKNGTDIMYDEASKYLEPTSSSCISRTAAQHYSEGMKKALKDNLDLLTSQCKGEKASLLEELCKLCDCGKMLRTVFDEEISDGYYTLYDRDYFVNIPDIEEETYYEDGKILAGVFFDKTRYYAAKCYEVKYALEKDLQSYVDMFFKSAASEYNSRVRMPVIGLLKEIFAADSNTDDEVIL